MDIPDINKIKGGVAKASETEIGKKVAGAVGDIAEGKVREIRKVASDKGLGEVFDVIENLAEKQLDMDLDGDGDIGK